MSDPRANRPSPISIRLSPGQRDELVRRASGRALSEYIKAELFGDGGQAPRAPSGLPAPTADRQLLGKILARFGDSQMGQSLSNLSESAAIGALIVDDDLRARLEETCNDIVQMRTMLMSALGKQSEGCRYGRPIDPKEDFT